MTGAIFTKIGIGVSLFSLFIIFGVGFMVQMGNEYGVTMESIYQNKFSTTEFEDQAYRSAEILDQGGIDAQTTDIAQLQAGISATKTQLNFFGVVKQSLNDLLSIFPFDPAIVATLLVMLVLMSVSGLIYLLFGRVN